MPKGRRRSSGVFNKTVKNPPKKQKEDVEVQARRPIFCGIETNEVYTRLALVIPKSTENEKDSIFYNFLFSFNINSTDKMKISTLISDGMEALMKKEVAKGLRNPENWKEVYVIKAICIALSGYAKPDAVRSFFEFFSTKHVGPGKLCEKLMICDEMNILGKMFYPRQEEAIIVKVGFDTHCRLFRKDGSAIEPRRAPSASGNGGGAYWIARTALDMCIRDVENIENHNYTGPSGEIRGMYTTKIKEIFMKQFLMDEETELYYFYQRLYSKANKYDLAAVAKELLINVTTGDEATIELFHLAGVAIGNLVKDVVEQSEEDVSNTKILIMCPVMTALNVMLSGFLDVLCETQIKNLELYSKREKMAVEAAAYAGYTENVEILTMSERPIFSTTLANTWV